ncbi:hypothetical protein EX30DRAFT_205379 [Ascodesmis nigricans]|uniref:Uncharacterized protein n=1 Tax=Ascodesmis nigricans TaxID=341454 RepID=A0A4V3SHS5_9PEZI|nr:hypothetical protein EX30DRAFT_205379 [Ascodesmis nigricans]
MFCYCTKCGVNMVRLTETGGIQIQMVFQNQQQHACEVSSSRCNRCIQNHNTNHCLHQLFFRPPYLLPHRHPLLISVSGKLI